MKIKYKLPFPAKVKTRMITSKSHKKHVESKHAIDFPLPVGTPVLAARAGKVSFVKSDSDKWGDNPKFAKDANVVAIDHGDGTYVEYIHFGKEKIIVKEGQKVKSGQILGYVGLSGYLTEPHLHFNAFKIKGKKGISIPIEFE